MTEWCPHCQQIVTVTTEKIPVPECPNRFLIRTTCMKCHRTLSTQSKSILTPRQLEVLEFLKEGYLIKEIADKLNLSPYTIKNFAKDARKRLRAGNSTHAVVIALREGYISLEGSREEN